MKDDSVFEVYPLRTRKGPSLGFQSGFLILAAVDAVLLVGMSLQNASSVGVAGYVVFLGLGAFSFISTILGCVLLYFAWAAKVSTWRLWLSVFLAGGPGLVLLHLIHGGRGLWP
jgi:hypothetical protein